MDKQSVDATTPEREGSIGGFTAMELLDPIQPYVNPYHGDEVRPETKDHDMYVLKCALQN